MFFASMARILSEWFNHPMLSCDLRAKGRAVEVPTTHFPPGSHEITSVATQHVKKVLTAITGIAMPDGSCIWPLKIAVHIPSQNMCIRYIP